MKCPKCAGEIKLMVDDAPKTKWCFSHGFREYGCLWYHDGRYEVSDGKNDTYSVEADNSLSGTACAQIALFLTLSRCFAVCLEVVRICFQPQATPQTICSQLPGARQRFHLPMI